jgi:hypothetical protein
MKRCARRSWLAAEGSGLSAGIPVSEMRSVDGQRLQRSRVAWLLQTGKARWVRLLANSLCGVSLTWGKGETGLQVREAGIDPVEHDADIGVLVGAPRHRCGHDDADDGASHVARGEVVR